MDKKDDISSITRWKCSVTNAYHKSTKQFRDDPSYRRWHEVFVPPTYITHIRCKNSVCFDFIRRSDPIFRLASTWGCKRHGERTRWPPPRRIDISQTSGSGIEIQFMDWAWAIRITLRTRFLSDNPRAQAE